MTEKVSNHEELRRVVPMVLAEAYENYIRVLPTDRKRIGIPFMSLGVVLSQEELVDSMLKDEEAGRISCKVFLEATEDELKEEGVEDPTPEKILEETVNRFNVATQEVREMENSQ